MVRFLHMGLQHLKWVAEYPSSSTFFAVVYGTFTRGTRLTHSHIYTRTKRVRHYSMHTLIYLCIIYVHRCCHIQIRQHTDICIYVCLNLYTCMITLDCVSCSLCSTWSTDRPCKALPQLQFRRTLPAQERRDGYSCGGCSQAAGDGDSRRLKQRMLNTLVNDEYCQVYD